MAKTLTQSDYHWAFVQLFGHDDDQAKQYAHVWQELFMFFKRQRTPDVDIEDLADDVMDRTFSKRVEGTQVENVRAYALGVARNVHKEYLKKRSKNQFISLTDYADEEADDLARALILSSDSAEESFFRQLESEELDTALEVSLSGLKPDDLLLLMRYVTLKARDREDLAKELGMSLNQLRVKVHRLKSVVRRSIEKKLTTKRVRITGEN